MAAIQKRCQKWILHAKINRKSGITQLSISICFQVTICNMATGGHFGFWLLTNSAAIFARVMGANFFLNTSKSSNQVKPYYALSGHGTPRLHPTTMIMMMIMMIMKMMIIMITTAITIMIMLITKWGTVYFLMMINNKVMKFWWGPNIAIFSQTLSS